MSKEFAVSFAIGATLAGSFKSVLGSAEKSVSGYDDELKKLGATQRNISSFDKVTSAIGRTKAKIVTAEKQLEMLNDEMTKSGKPTRKMVAEQGKLLGQIDTLNEKLRKETSNYSRLSSSLEKAEIDTKDLVGAQKKLGASMEAISKKRAKYADIASKKEQNLNKRSKIRASIFDTVALGAAVALPIREAMAFEDVMGDVAKNVKGLNSAADVKVFSQQIRKIGKNSAMTSPEIARLASEAGKIGMAKEEALEFADLAATMGTAFDLSADDAGSSIAKIKATMGMTLPEIRKMGDVVNYLGDNTASSAANITNILKRQGGLVKSVTNLTVKEIAALSAVLDANAPNAETAATSLKNLTLALTSGGKATKAQQEAFVSMGFDAEEFAARMQGDAKGGIMELFGALSRLDPEKQAAMLSTLFGKESIGAIAPMMGNLSALEDVFAKVGKESNHAGSMQDEYDRSLKKSSTKLKIFKGKMQEIGITMGNVLLPSLNMGLKVFGGVADFVDILANKFPVLTSVVIGVTGGVIGLTIASKVLGYGFTFLKGGYLNIVTVATRLNIVQKLATVRTYAVATAQKIGVIATKAVTAAQWLWNAAMTANPIGLVIAGVVALGAGAYMLIKHWDTVRVFFGNLWQSVTGWMGNINLFESGKKIIGTMVSGIKSVAMAPFNAVKSVFTKVRELLPFSDAKTGPLSDLTTSGMKIIDTLGVGIRKASPDLKNTTGQALDVLSGNSSIGAGGSSQSININYSPQITITGNADAAVIDDGLMLSESRLKSMIENIMQNEMRVSYA